MLVQANREHFMHSKDTDELGMSEMAAHRPTGPARRMVGLAVPGHGAALHGHSGDSGRFHRSFGSAYQYRTRNTSYGDRADDDSVRWTLRSGGHLRSHRETTPARL